MKNVFFLHSVLVGVCAFFTHFYWTKIGISEIWNTTRWSSMRSSIYQKFGQLGRNAASQPMAERPTQNEPVYSSTRGNDSNPYYSEEQQTYPPTSSYVSQVRPSAIEFYPKESAVPSISYNRPVRVDYASKIGQPMESTRIHSLYEYQQPIYDPITGVERRRF